MEKVRKYEKEGAGFVVFKRDTLENGKPLLLALVQADGVYDIPKGVIDGGESDLEAAKRECFEECSIVIRDVDMLFTEASPHKHGALTTFCASTDQTPHVTINPHSGILEHQDFQWVEKDKFINNCLSYLVHPVNHFYSAYDKSYNG